VSEKYRFSVDGGKSYREVPRPIDTRNPYGQVRKRKPAPLDATNPYGPAPRRKLDTENPYK
jgi:hypothetical protein